MIDIRALTEPLDPCALHGMADGYTSESRYQVTKSERRLRTEITLELVPAARPIEVKWRLTGWDVDLWHKAVAEGTAFGAFEAQSAKVVGFCISRVERWNRTLRVWDLGVAEAYRRRGVGRRLLDHAADSARKKGCRVVVCETQNTNVAAIAFYRRAGFELHGIDLSYYSNEDLCEDGQVALFMKRRL